tara:strand:- start:1924 stop:2499 length:576 start_codon:yes stop_codon:yes gene_type:complete
MTVNDVLKKLRVMLAADTEVVTETKFAEATLVDGTVVYTDGELEVGKALLIRTEDGVESPYAPEGIHETTDGQLIGVGPNGEIMDISDVAETTEEVVEEQLEEVAVVAEVPEGTEMPAAMLLEGIAELIAPFTEEIASLTEEVIALKARFAVVAGEPAAKPIRNSFSENKKIKDNMVAKRMDALRAIRTNK